MVHNIREAFEAACINAPLNRRPLAEPFVGSAAVAYGLECPEVYANDLCFPVINFHQWVRQGLSLDKISLENSEENYYDIRDKFNRLTFHEGKADSQVAAACFYFMNRTGYNGLIRFSPPPRGMGFSTPKGDIKNPDFIKDFSPWKERMEDWVFSSVDFEAMEFPAESAVFIDSPYDTALSETADQAWRDQYGLFDPFDIENAEFVTDAKERRAFTTYSGRAFTWSDQLRVVRFAISIPNPVVITNLATPRILELYSKYGFETHLHQVKRCINNRGNGRQPVTEVIAIKREKQ